jgi:hypothetical protein
LIGQAAKTKEAHKRTIVSSKSLAAVAVDYFIDPGFRKDVTGDFKII